MDKNHEQEGCFRQRATDSKRRWKLSPMDQESWSRWLDYTKAKDRMMEDTDIKHSPWYLVPSADKKRARLICISHILGQIPYEDILPEPIELLAREYQTGYIRPPFDEQTFCAGHLLEPAMAYARCDFRPPKTGSRVKDLSIINFGWGE